MVTYIVNRELGAATLKHAYSGQGVCMAAGSSGCRWTIRCRHGNTLVLPWECKSHSVYYWLYCGGLWGGLYTEAQQQLVHGTDEPQTGRSSFNFRLSAVQRAKYMANGICVLLTHTPAQSVCSALSVATLSCPGGKTDLPGGTI